MHKFIQGPCKTFLESWKRLRYLAMECPQYGVFRHELTKMFFDGFGPQDKYLYYAMRSRTFKYEDNVIKFIGQPS